LTSQKAPARARPRLILASVLVVVALAWGAQAAAQEVPPTTAPGPTPELLVPGDTTPATTAPSAGDSVPTVSVPDGGDEGGGDGGLDASTKVWLIVIGLLLVAGVTIALTVLYWRHTQPGRIIAEKPEREPRRWPWTREPEPEQPLDPTLRQPRPGPVAAEASEPEPEPPPEPEEPAPAPRPAHPEPDYWSGV